MDITDKIVYKFENAEEVEEGLLYDLSMIIFYALELQNPCITKQDGENSLRIKELHKSEKTQSPSGD
jgi:hypothetical protein